MRVADADWILMLLKPKEGMQLHCSALHCTEAQRLTSRLQQRIGRSRAAGVIFSRTSTPCARQTGRTGRTGRTNDCRWAPAKSVLKPEDYQKIARRLPGPAWCAPAVRLFRRKDTFPPTVWSLVILACLEEASSALCLAVAARITARDALPSTTTATSREQHRTVAEVLLSTLPSRCCHRQQKETIRP
ncbi:hypothetical protein EG329_006283 [Mollisiaceae sp. DMI_Dod_QoI]|nr:hypothetical protein EG329_006283 [Helotiales sp. DMI_Dod_QoI]